VVKIEGAKALEGALALYEKRFGSFFFFLFLLLFVASATNEKRPIFVALERLSKLSQ